MKSRKFKIVALALSTFNAVVPFSSLAASESVSAINILTLLPQSRPETDYTAVINKQLAAGKSVFLPNTGTPFLVSDAIEFKTPGAALLGEIGTTLVFVGKHTIFRIRAANSRMQNIIFDGSRIGNVDRNEAYCIAPNFQWTGGGMHKGGPTFLQAGCDHAKIDKVKYDFNSSTAFTVQSNDVTISNSEFENNVGFGIVATKGASNFHFLNNNGKHNGIEMIAASQGAHDGEIVNNHITGSGDNCISVTGDRIKVANNSLERCLAIGIAVYGSNNLITLNQISDNGQVNNSSAPPIELLNGKLKSVFHSPGYNLGSMPGIKVVNGFGGEGSLNVVQLNTLSDDQVQKTQDGIAIAHEAKDNLIGPNKVKSYKSYEYLDQTSNHSNRHKLE